VFFPQAIVVHVHFIMQPRCDDNNNRGPRRNVLVG